MKSLREKAYFGGGCFWCTESIFSQVRGVSAVTSGYAGGYKENPTYFQVSEGLTGHAEVVEVEYDPKIISYTQLLEIFFASHDPTSLNQQGADKGEDYRSIILASSARQLNEAVNMKRKLTREHLFTRPIVTEIRELDHFYPAEEYQQKYYERNPDALYCQIVIEPKLAAFRQRFQKLLKEKT